MRKTNQKKKKLPLKKRKKSLVRKTKTTKKKKITRKKGRPKNIGRPKKKTTRKKNKPKKTKKTAKNKKVSTINFVIEKKDEFLIDSSDDTPVINFQSDFLTDKTDVDELLNEVEIDDQNSILIKNTSSASQPEAVLNNFSIVEKKDGLDRLIQEDYVFTEKSIKDAT